MITFQYIEDYIEVLAGYRELIPGGKSPGPCNIFADSVIRLARYDVSFLTSMANNTFMGQALTDRQGELAVKLVDKYKKQFFNQGIDVGPSVQNPKFRFPLRVIDRSKTITLVDKKIRIKFPYNNEMVSEISAASKESRGKFLFNRTEKYWELALTENNVNWAVCFGNKHKFDVDHEVTSLMDMILEVEKKSYSIELFLDENGQPTISNAADTLTSYINDHLGGLNLNNLLCLIDSSSILGYSVDQKLFDTTTSDLDPIETNILINREIHIVRSDLNSSERDLSESILKYSQKTKRFPIYIYEPDGSENLKSSFMPMFKPEEFLNLSNLKNVDEIDLSSIKCVYFNKIKKEWNKFIEHIPILISTSSMIYGAEKFSIVQKAEKLVFYTATVYGKSMSSMMLLHNKDVF
jgi:hypothetical protein